MDRSLGHRFERVSFKKPTYCHTCSEFLWGLSYQGVQCELCNFVSHERCVRSIAQPCSHKAASHVQHPAAHSLCVLVDATKRFCNVCRTRINDTNPGLECGVCPYYVHRACRRKVVHNCKIYTAACEYSSSFPCKQRHHWMEGHLPASSKCKVCAKICSSAECLTGLQCTWCLTTVHSSCCAEYHLNCSFGQLRTLTLPPSIVTYRRHVTRPDTMHTEGEPNSVSDNNNNSENSNNIRTKTVRVLQGSLNDENKIFRDVMVTNRTTTADVVAEALMNFNISDEQSKYHLTQYQSDKTEIKLDEEERVFTYMVGEGSPEFYLRNVFLDKKELRITILAG